MSKIINQLNRSVDHQTCRSLSDRAAIVPKGRLSTRLHSASYVGQAFGLLFIFIFLISTCGLDVEDPTPPSPPQWVPKSLPEEWPERGIDAHESGGIYFEWMPSLEEDIVSYEIYRARWFTLNDSLSDYLRIAKLETESYPVLEYIDIRATIGFKYFYKLKSVDASGNQSAFSDSISYALLSAINAAVVTPNGQNTPISSERTLKWWYSVLIEMEDYCITILSDNDDLMFRERIQPTNYFGGWEQWHVPPEIEFQPGNIYKWRVDMGGQYLDSRETHGSESEWAKFLYTNE